MNIGEMMKMAGKAQARFMQRTYDRITDRSDAYQRGEREYGTSCIYCESYFVNIKKPKFGGYVCKNCKEF